ncbi:MAG: ATP-binding protein [Kofleriaceae bacterium]|nr:ATP-binding protein [Kofleriaceae bacterium]
MRFLGRLISAGVSDATPERLARQLRVTNGLALLGFALSVLSAPIDIMGGILTVVASDLVGGLLFASTWILNARGFHVAGRVVLCATANAVMLVGVLGAGAAPELRSVFFPLVLMPFLVFDLRERLQLFIFVTLPVVSFFGTGWVPQHAPHSALKVYLVYAPLLAFTMIIGGSVIFAYLERTASDRLLRTRAKAAQASRLVALGEMASGIAHEIRNPLAAIRLAASHIVANPDDPAMVRALGERVQRIVVRADRIIDALRSFSRDASGDPFTQRPVARVVSEALELCGKRFSDNNVALTVADIPSDLVIDCRSVQLSQVLVNLLGNAYDAVVSTTAPWVRIDVDATDGWLELSVTDSGSGIPVEARPRLFEPFFTTKGPERGTGLGLSLSKTIVEAHNGTLELDVEVPNTRFVIRVPLVHDAGDAGTATRQAQ